jgi:hypothetical protein
MGTNYDFNWSVAFPFHTLQDLVLEVKDKNRRWSEIGGSEKNFSVMLIHKSSLGLTTTSETLHLKYRLKELNPSPTLIGVPALNLLENRNTRGGVIRSLIDGCGFGSFTTWQMHLREVDMIFEDNYCSWN